MSEVSGGDKLKAALDQIAKKLTSAAKVEIGFFEDQTYPDGTPVALVAAVQQWGAPSRGIPPRPFMTKVVADHSAEWPDQVATLLKANDLDAKKTLGQMGALIESEITDAIFEFDGVPNSPVTNLLKQRFPQGGQTFADVLKAREDVRNGATAPAGKQLVQSGLLASSPKHQVT